MSGRPASDVTRSRHPVEADVPAAPDPGRRKVTVTPHIASITDPTGVVAQIVENIRRSRAGRPLLHQVDAARGY